MALDYTLNSNSRDARPRSKRLRESGAPSTAPGGTVIVNNISGGEPTEGHTHANKSALDQITTDGDGYQWLTRTVEVEDPDTGEIEVRTIREKVKAGYADFAKDISKDSPIWDEFLSKAKDDRSKGTVASDKGLEVGEFVSGVSGAAIRKRADGLTEAEVDMLYVRVKAMFETLTAVRTESLAGEQLVTPAGSLKCREVEDMGDCWRCYFLAEQDGERIENTFALGDQARCSYFNASQASGNHISNKFYWRLVTGVGADYIDISKSDCADGSDIPEAGDVICQLGNRTDSTRQSAVRISTVLGNPPSVCLMNGIDSYDLTGCDVVSMGVDSATGRPFLRCYGDMTLGDRTGAKSFLSYDSLTGIMDYKGRLNLLSTVGNDTLGGYIAKQIGGNMLRLDLSNEMEGVACDVDGNPVGKMPSTEITVYKGSSADSGWTFGKTDSGCVSAFLTDSIIEVASLDPDVNTATVTVTATKPGHTPLLAVMSIYKVIPGKSGADGKDGKNGTDGKDGAAGSDGKSATVFSLLPSVNSVTRHADGSLSANAVTCTVLKTTGDSTPLASNEHMLSYRRLPDGAAGTLTRSNGVSQSVQIIPGTESVVFELKSGNTVLDRERVPVLSDVEGFGEGGENLILNAGFTSFENWDAPRKDMVIDAGNRFNGSNVVKIKTEGYESNMWRGFWQRYTDNPHFKCEPDTYYSFSIWAYTPDRAALDGAHFDIYVYDSNGVSLMAKPTNIAFTANEAWRQFKGTFKTPATAHHFNIEFWSLRNGEVWFSKPQLVRGAFLPDWSPSPYDFDYVTEALKNSGSFEAGLLLASLIKLGYTDEHGDYRVMAGLNGIAKDTTGRDIAFWGGGDMVDADNGDDMEGAATAAIRFDGTAYFARNVIRLLKESMCIGSDVLLDREGVKLMVDGDVRAIMSNRPVAVDFGKLASNVKQLGDRTHAETVDVPMSLLGTFRMAVYRTVEKSYDLGKVPSGSTGSCYIDVTAMHAFDYGHPTKGIWPISSLARAELRCGDEVVATFRLSTFSTVRYNSDLPGNKTGGSIVYDIHESISFTCPTEGIYTLAIVFPETSSAMDGSSAGNLDCSVRVFGTVKHGLGNLTTIGSDGFASIWGESAIAVNSSTAAIRSGLYGMILDKTKGLRATLNGGQTWFTLKQSGGQLIFTT